MSAFIGFVDRDARCSCPTLLSRERRYQPEARRINQASSDSIRVVLTPYRTPMGQRHFRRAITEFVAHYHLEWNHQGLYNRLVARDAHDRRDRLLASARAAGKIAELLRARRDQRIC
jgi:hypothetical protein